MEAILALLNRLAAAANALTAATDANRAAAQADLDAVQAELDTALGALTAEELAEVDAALRGQLAEADTARQSAATTQQRADALAQMQTIRDGIVAVGAEQTRRDEEQARVDEQAAAILAEVTPPVEETETEEETETPAEGTEMPAEGETETSAETTETPEAVAASAAPRPRRAPLSALRATQPADTLPVSDTHGGIALVASMGATGVIREGAQITDRLTLGALMKDAHRRLGSGTGGKEDRVIVASGVQVFEPGRELGDDPTVNAARIEEARADMFDRARAFLRQTPEAMVASGGFCGLTTPIYDSPMISQRGRPVRNGFAISMQAPRAGIRHPIPLALSDIPVGNAEGDAVWLWDNDTDIAALDGNEVKPCWHIECGDFTEEFIEAIGICLEFGNLGQMSHPERFAQATELADVAHDRVTETLLLDAIKAKSVRQTRARALGAAKDFFAALNLKAAHMRAVNRMDAGDSLTDSPLIWTGPDWLLEAFRVDILRTQFPGETSWDFSAERLMAHFRAAVVVPTFYVDTPTGAEQIPEFGDDGDEIPEFPTHAEWGLAVPGVHLVLEAPEINMGQVRDSVLNAKNNVRTFTETFQGHAMIGPAKSSAWVRQELCPDGSVAEAVETSGICGTTAS